MRNMLLRNLAMLIGLLSVHVMMSLGVKQKKTSKRSDDKDPVTTLVHEQGEQLIKLQGQLEAATNQISAFQLTITSLQDQLQTSQKQMSTVQQDMRQELLDKISQGQTASAGSTFIRWGKSACPDQSTLLYSGFAGAAYIDQAGSGTNRLCLTQEPVFDVSHAEYYNSKLVGIEYFLPDRKYTDVVCAVCLANYSATFMLPGSNKCPPGTNQQYSGHLTAGAYDHDAGSEFLCLDVYPEDRPNSTVEGLSGYMEYARTECGALPCPPYQENKVPTCAVCSV